MSDSNLSPDGKWMWDGSEWVPHHGNEQNISLSDSVVSGDIIASQSVQSVDAEVIKAAMSGVIGAIKELQPQSENVPDMSNSNSDDARIRELELEAYLFEENRREENKKRKRSFYRRKSKRRNFRNLYLYLGFIIGAIIIIAILLDPSL